MKVFRCFIASALLLFSLPAFAHGNMDHILGIVKTLAGNVVSVEKDGKVTEVTLVKTTTYEVNGHPGKINDLRVGDRVVIHALKVEGKETAHDVRFAHP